MGHCLWLYLIQRECVDFAPVDAWMVAIGLTLGLAAALALMKVMTTLLFEVSPLDPFAFALAAASMAVIGLVAALIPASRATRVDPVTALRVDA
jgi:ABC-type antimicrobial peptide transport system permease subunit